MVFLLNSYFPDAGVAQLALVNSEVQSSGWGLRGRESLLEAGKFHEPVLPQFRIANRASEMLGIALFSSRYF